MCQFFEKRGYPASVIQAAHHRAQQIDRQSTLQTSQKEKNDRIPFTLTFHPRNNPVKAIILNNFKILQNDPETGAIFSQPPLISFKRDKNVGNFIVRSAFKTIERPGTFKCARSRCKTCPFVRNADKISGPKRSVKITDRFTCTSANVIYCITCTLCKKLYIGETGRRLGDRFREHLRDVEKDDKDASKPVARHFNLPNHSKEHMSICGLSLHQGTTDSRKNLEQRFIFQIGTLNPQRTLFIQLIYSCFSRYLVPTNSVAPSSVYKAYTTHNSSICSDEGLRLETSAFQSLYGGQFTLSTLLINQIFVFHSPHRRSTTVSLETNPLCPHESLFKIGLNSNTRQSSSTTKDSHYMITRLRVNQSE